MIVHKRITVADVQTATSFKALIDKFVESPHDDFYFVYPDELPVLKLAQELMERLVLDEQVKGASQ